MPRVPPLLTSGLPVTGVEPDSAAARIPIAVGDRILAINGHRLEDVIDLWFYGSDERLRIQWEDKSGERHSATLSKAYHERLGLEVEPFEVKRCANQCLFCFVHQLPRGLRRELYVKDEDYRLSFLYGNYITGTNLTRADKQRIARMKLSPLFISVHATDNAVREKLLGKPHVEPIMPLMRWFADRNIYLHAQIVLCPGINDGAVLERTCDDLATLYPLLESVAIVPLGLTDHRDRLPKLQGVTAEYARAFLPKCARLQARLKSRIGTPLVFPSDEFYLMICRTPPSYSTYPEIPQLANGVGMYYRFYRHLAKVIREMPAPPRTPWRVAAVTTALGERVLARLADALRSRAKDLRLDLLVTENTLFGKEITVSGLIPGGDFRRVIGANPGYDRYLIPENSLRPWDLRFLDGMGLDELRASTTAEIVIAGETAESFVAAALKSSEVSSGHVFSKEQPDA